jgi:hypothetical protein
MNNYDACTTIAIMPAPPGLYNVFAIRPDCEIQHGKPYWVGPCVAILLQEAEMCGQRITHVVFAARDAVAPGLLRSVFSDPSYVATLTQSELDDGEADRLVAERAELDALEDLEEDAESAS